MQTIHASPEHSCGSGAARHDALSIDVFSSALYATQNKRVAFHESHDEAGNSAGTARTMVVAVNSAPIIDATRVWAEARSRLCFGLSVLSAGTPMFFMAEEIGALKRYTFDGFLQGREDILGEREGNGKLMFRFYQDLITLARRLSFLGTARGSGRERTA